MKKFIPFALAAAFTASALGQEAVSNPVGYETITLQPGQFNFFGLRLSNPVLASGAFESGTADSLTDNEGNFAFAAAGTDYVVEFPDGSVIVTDGSNLAAAGIISNLGGGAVGFETSNYIIREVSTLTDVFGPANEAGLLAASSIANADVVQLANADGTFNQVYFNEGIPGVIDASWQDAAGNVVDPPILYTDGIIVQSRSTSPVSVVVSGSVVLQPKAFSLSGDGSFNFVSSVFPAGSTLGNSGLQSTVTASDSIASADIVFFPQADGTFQQFFFNSGIPGVIDPSWQDAGGADATNQIIPPAFIIQRRATGDTTGTITPPASYNNL